MSDGTYVLVVGVLAICWFGTIVYLVVTGRANENKFKLANMLSVGTLGLILGRSRPGDINNRERIGLLFLVTLLIFVVVASLVGIT